MGAYPAVAVLPLTHGDQLYFMLVALSSSSLLQRGRICRRLHVGDLHYILVRKRKVPGIWGLEGEGGKGMSRTRVVFRLEI